MTRVDFVVFEKNEFLYTHRIMKKREKSRVESCRNDVLHNKIVRSEKYRSSRLQMFFEKSVLKNFANFTGKHLCWSLYLIKLQA